MACLTDILAAVEARVLATPVPVEPVQRVCLAVEGTFAETLCGRYTHVLASAPDQANCPRCLQREALPHAVASWLASQRARGACVARPERPNVSYCGLYRADRFLRPLDQAGDLICDACQVLLFVDSTAIPDWRPPYPIAEDHYAA